MRAVWRRIVNTYTGLLQNRVPIRVVFGHVNRIVLEQVPRLRPRANSVRTILVYVPRRVITSSIAVHTARKVIEQDQPAALVVPTCIVPNDGVRDALFEGDAREPIAPNE